MATLKHTFKVLQQKNSKSHVVFLVIFLLLVLSGALALRYYTFIPLKLNESTMYPRHSENELLWVCKHPRCLQKISSGESVWARLRNGETLFREVLAMPGDTLTITNRGLAKSGRRSKMFKKEDAFIETRTIYIPKKGDTLFLNQLNDVEEDYALNLMQEQGLSIFVKSSLWQGDREISINRAGSTKLGNRQVSLQEIDRLPWQDRYLMELQIFRSEPGNAPIRLRRNFFNANDSTPVTSFVVQENCYFLTCEKGTLCADSRELGYFTQSRLLGRYVSEPRKAINFVKKNFKELKKLMAQLI